MLALVGLFLMFTAELATAEPVPFRCIGNLIIVEAEVNNQCGSFLLDTGSPGLVLNRSHYTGKRLFGQNQVIYDLYGQSNATEELVVHSASISGMQLSIARASVMDLSTYRITKDLELLGIIGYGALWDKQLIIDFSNSHLIIEETERTSQMGRYSKVDSAHFTLTGHLPCLQATFAGKKFWFALDTGSEVNIFHIKHLKGRAEWFRGSGRIRLKGLGSTTKLQSKVWLKYIGFGKVSTDSVEVVLTNLNPISATMDFRLDGVLGVAFLKDHPVCINYREQKIYFLAASTDWAGRAEE